MESERALTRRLLEIGFSHPDTIVYAELVSGRSSSVQRLLQNTRLSPDEIQPAVARLQMLCLIRVEIVGDRSRLRAVEPTLAWVALLYDESWRALVDGAAGDLTLFSSEMKGSRAEAIAIIVVAATDLFKARDRRQREHQKLFECPDQFALSCSHALMRASTVVVAAERSPKLPHVALFWTAIAEMRKRAVRYRRYVGLSEVFLHGLEITARDVEEFGVEMRYLPEEAIPTSLYLIDSDILYLFRVDHEGTPFSGRVSHNPEVIERFRETKIAQMERCARTFADVKISLLSHAERLRDRARVYGDDLAVFDKIAKLGKFARLVGKDRIAANAMCTNGLLQKQPGGFSLSLRGVDWEGLA